VSERPPESFPGMPEVDLAQRLSHRIDTDGQDPAKGLAQLVLTLVELIRQIVERQALHRVESGSLDADEVERLGQALMALEDRMTQLRDVFGVTEDDLNLDLGPLGRLL
jgi:hypothetical protein